ncbi:MAG: pantoate--beta-alanine ligase [Gammaproteobacteria bacterium]|nr:pantoate--beta-alanine ligase [Gammaproteobacteria bacterium]|tara:strand:- start:2657 stop:3487 length:831 start_codon:yes stop_codon:yes gene_type:complete
MKIFKSVEKFISSKLQVQSFVPTMGNLHQGHLSLITEAKKKSGNICVSLYVNENQFTNKKDFDLYPITLDSDIKNLKKIGIDYLLIPEKKDIENFSRPFDVKLEPKEITEDLCGKYRPGHFLAVIDIVHRFFQIVKPKNILLGRKDYQQIIAISELIKIYNYNIDIISSDTVRNKNGLALSSRNNLLSKEEMKTANEIYRSLLLSKQLYNNNVSLNEIIAKIYKVFEKSEIKLEYFSIRDLKTLQHRNDSDLIALIAVYLGDIRLIDNIIIKSRAV